MSTASNEVQIFAPSGTSLRLSGVLADSIRRGSDFSPALRAAAIRTPILSELLSRLEREKLQPLHRAALLRGSGFDTLFVELTARCNERCVHCYADASPERHETLTPEAVDEIVADAALLGFRRVQFTGGDPLIAPTLMAAVSAAHAHAIAQIEIYTNGLALTEGLFRALVPYRPHFAFSVYSGEADEHDTITRVPGSHARTLRAIRMCLENGVPARVGVTLLEESSRKRDGIRNSLLALGMEERDIGFTMSHAVGRGDYAEGDNDSGQHAASSIGAGKACVLATGDVVPCIFARSAVLGNVYQRRLAEVLEEQAELADPSSLDERLRQASMRLSCSECRIRDVLIARSGGFNLVHLRRRS